MVLTCVRTWFVAAGKVAKPADFDPTKKFTDYGVLFPAFLECCDDLTGKDDGTPSANGPGSINTSLANEGCGSRVTLNAAWRLAHQSDAIDDFISSVVTLIITPPANQPPAAGM
jgi:hypothetical protein